MSAPENDEEYSAEEAQRRLEAALLGARQVSPIKMKDIPRKRPYRVREAAANLKKPEQE